MGERWTALTAGIREKRFIVVGLLGGVVSAADWISEQLGARGMVTGVPSWTVGAIVVLCVIAWWLLDYTVELRRQLTPKLLVDFGQDINGCVKSQRGEPSTDFQKAVSINVRVKSTATIDDCRGTLVSVEKLVNGSWERQKSYSGIQILKWNYIGPGGIRINPTEEHLLHVVILYGPDGRGVLAGHNPDAQMHALVNSSGTFKFNVCLSGTATVPSYISISFKRGNPWERPEVSRA